MSVKPRKIMFAFLLISFLFSINLSQNSIIAQPLGWSESIRLTDNINSSVGSVIGVWDNYIHVFWREKVPGPSTDYDIFYMRSIDGGKTWEATRKLIDTDKSLGGLSMDLNQSTIHLVWHDGRSGSNYVYYTKSNDSGENWEVEKIISSPSSGAYDPDIAINDTYIHVVYWHNFKLFYMNSTDNGDTWSEVQQLTGPIRDSDEPAIAVNESNVHIVWKDLYDKYGNPTAGAIFYMNSTDNGLTWSEDINLTEMNLHAAWPYIAVNNSMIHVVYSKEIAGLWQGYYKRSEDNGITWIEDVKIMNPPNDLFIDDFTIENSRLYVIGGEAYIPDEEIYFVENFDNGQNWEDDIRLTYYPEDSQEPSIAVYNYTINVIWQDYRDGSGTPEIYYKHYPVPYPPTNLTIDKRFTDDLILTWEHPQNSPSPVDHYHIYRSTTWDSFDFSSPWVDTSVDFDNGIIPLRTSWNLTGALLDESTNYFYIVRAIDAEGWNDTNTNIVGKYVIPMKKGWNLISLPLAQRNTSISKVLQTIDGEYNVIWVYNVKEDRWLSSITDFTDINRTMGLWIHMKNSCNLSIIGAVPESTDITLYEGWNLVGYPSLTDRNLNEALGGITWNAVQHYDAFDLNDHWKHNCTSKPDKFNDLKIMQPGHGYWIYVTINDTWTTTRMTEDNKMVVWRIPSLEDEVGSQNNYEAITHNPIDTDEENKNPLDVVPEEPIDKNEGDRIDFSLISLIILIAFIFAEIIILRKRWR